MVNINLIFLFPILAGFFVTLLFVPFWIRKAKEIGLMWDDMNKLSSEKVAGSGGIIVVLGFVIGIFIFIGYSVFVLQQSNFLVEVFALLTTVLLLAGIGLIDDLFGWHKGGLSVRSRLILVFLASIPLMVINAGRSEIVFPILGNINLGIIYPLIFIPIGIVGAATTFNFLAGFNGLEAGQGVLLLFSLGIVSIFTGNLWLAIVAFTMVASLFGFLIYNSNPAKVFPGDSLTLVIGGLIAMIAILGNFEKVAVFFFIPYILETFLTSRGKLKKQSFGRPNKNGELGLRYNKLYSLSHVSIALMMKLGIKPTEKRVVYSLLFFQLMIIILGFLIFRQGIFK